MKFESINEVCIKWRKDLDNAILGEIKARAIENGIKTEYLLNEKAIISALEKQIPKKLITETEDDREFIDYLCPSCKVTLQQKYKQSKISTIYKYKHCPDCGQALDWSDTE